MYMATIIGGNAFLYIQNTNITLYLYCIMYIVYNIAIKYRCDVTQINKYIEETKPIDCD